MVRVGLTGGYGTGKSTVAGMFSRLGARVLDADEMAHRALSLKTPSGRRVLKAFGRGILLQGRISRARLARIVFDNPRKRKLLEHIVHPVVIQGAHEEMASLRSPRIVMVNAPLLIEAGMHRSLDYTIVVVTDRKTQNARLERKGIPAREISNRIRSQMPLARKKEFADFIIDNNGSRLRTYQQVRQIFKVLNILGGHSK
ncbi:MAG: dephospho-CoA kinase [Candidatus Omnitrophica bacterium]|nr:dephospho-CoA kinase [Candidatus Omnitrophota bacterium]